MCEKWLLAVDEGDKTHDAAGNEIHVRFSCLVRLLPTILRGSFRLRRVFRLDERNALEEAFLYKAFAE